MNCILVALGLVVHNTVQLMNKVFSGEYSNIVKNITIFYDSHTITVYKNLLMHQILTTLLTAFMSIVPLISTHKVSPLLSVYILLSFLSAGELTSQIRWTLFTSQFCFHSVSNKIGRYKPKCPEHEK